MATEDQRDSRRRTTSTMLSTTDDLTAAAQALYRTAEAAPDEGIRRRLRALGDAVLEEARKIRARIAGLAETASKSADEK